MNHRIFETKGIGTSWVIEIFDSITDVIWEESVNTIQNIINDFELKYSRFNNESFIGKLNLNKEISDFPVEMYEMFKFGQNIYDITQGNFDFAVGTHLNNLGYDQNRTFINNNTNSDIQNSILYFDKDKISIAPHVTFDLGGIGKGFLIDKISSYLKTGGLRSYIINGGGDIYCTSKDNNPFHFFLENPFNISEYIGTIDICNSSIACSSSSKRKWTDIKTNKDYHHLINAKTGKSVENISSVFTHSSKALNADTASTAIFVSPLNLTDVIAEFLQVEYLIVYSDGNCMKSKHYPGKLNI